MTEFKIEYIDGKPYLAIQIGLDIVYIKIDKILQRSLANYE